MLGRPNALLLAVIAVLSLGSPGDAAAQVCAGGPSLTSYGGSLGGGFSFFDGGGGFDVHATFGGDWFGTVVIGRRGFDDSPIDLSSVSVAVGRSSEVPGDSHAYLCPSLEIARGWWSRDTFDDDVGTSLRVTPSLGIGVDLASSSLSLIPFARLGMSYDRYSFDREDGGRGESDGVLTLGAGLTVLEHDTVIVPSVAIPLISSAGDIVVRVQIGAALGGNP